MCMNRTLVNMLKCPGTQMKVEELGHLWLRTLHGAFEAFVQLGSKWLRRQPSQWIINTKAKLGFHAASCVIVEIIWSCVMWFDWHQMKGTQTEVKREIGQKSLSSAPLWRALLAGLGLLAARFLTLPCPPVILVTHKTHCSFKKKVQIRGWGRKHKCDMSVTGWQP